MAETDRDRAQRLLAERTPSSSQALAVATLFPLGGILLTLSGLTLTATIIGLTVAFPLFVIFSPVLVPAAMLVGLALTGFFASGAMGVTAVRALSVVGRVLGRVFSRESMEMVRRRMAEAAEKTGARTKDVGGAIQSRAHEYGRT